jgi:leader peptidase (prepilin peptidase)/N-methyltransferase
MTELLFFIVGALCSWPMQHFIVRLPAEILETPSPLPTSPQPKLRLAVLNGFIWSACAWHWPTPETAVCWSVFASTLLALTIIDWQTTLLPDALTQPLLWLGLLASATQLTPVPLEQSVWGAAIGYAALWLVATLFSRITGKEGMGAGDFKLLAALGAWLGPWALLPLVFLASLVGALVGLWLQARQRLHQGVYVPFGPFLAAAGMVLAITGHAFFLDLLTH